MGRVEGKVAIVTGGAQGLGKADCEALVREGAKVVVTDVKESEGQATAAELNALRPGNAIFLKQDVRDEQRWIEVVAKAVETFGGLHILVNNAGLVRMGTPDVVTLDDFRLHNAVMSEGVFLGCKHAIPAMAKSGGGSIINVSSVASHLGYPVYFSYSAAKGAVRAMTKSLAVWCQMNKWNIRVNSIHPGATDTEMVQNSARELGVSVDVFRETGPGLGRPEDVANVVLFLASDESKYLNGAELLLDNALTIQ